MRTRAKPSTASRQLTEALRRCFDLIRQEARAGQGDPLAAVPSLPMVKGRWAAMTRAWAACPDADAVYRATLATWIQETGCCPWCGGKGCSARGAAA